MRWRPLLSAAAVLAGLTVVPTLAASAPAEDLTALVNPLAGSLGPGFVTVAAGLPFGMVTPGPITTTPAGDDPVNYVGYAYQDPEVRGFALTHFSGAGIHIGGELPMMPTTGAVTSSDPSQWASPVSHATETARPGYYSTTLSRYQTLAELTATPRVAVERFTFPATTQANLLLDISRDNDGVQAGTLQFDGDSTVRGSVTVPGDNDVTMFFTARFDRPFTSHGTWLGPTLTDGGSAVSGNGAGGWVSFDTTEDQVVGARVAMSYVDAAGADANLVAEAPDGTAFGDVASAAKQTWNDRLHSIDVTGGPPGQRATFYTNLYHALLMPDVFDDADGRYLGFDDVVRTVDPGHHHYTDLSLWDTYRTQTPLLTLVAPDVAHDVGISLLDDADQNPDHQMIPKWVRGNRDYSIMGGDSGTPTLATLVTNGALTGPDAQRAYDAVLRQAHTAAGPRNDLGDYLSLGYIPYEHSDRGAAVTLEYAIDDAAVAALATSYGTSDQQTEMRARAESWHNLFDREGTRFLRPRHVDGTWASPTPFGEGPAWDPMFSDGWQEGTGWQYLWLVPQDVAGLRDTLGADTMTQRLDEFFGTPAQSQAAPVMPLAQTQASFFGVYYVGNQYTPANETDLQAPWLYDWLGAPSKTARVVHAGAQVFSTSPYGLPGNDDAGTMSAAYVLDAIGLYQAQPGVDAWELSTPMFDSVVVNGPGGSGPRLTINAPGAGPAMEYVADAKLSLPQGAASPIDRTWLSNGEIRSGRTLTYTLSPIPTDWATGTSSAPPSLSDQHR